MQRLIAIVVVFFSSTAVAVETVTLGTMIVTDSSAPELDWQLGDVLLDEQTGFTSVITRDAFADRITSLADVIQEESGVQVRQAGGLGAFASVSVRGASAQQVNVFLDGLPLNAANGGAVDLGRIGLADIGQVEIYRGITPIQLARPGLGGAINIRTLRPAQDHRSRVDLGYGSFDTRQANTIHHQVFGQTDVVATLGYLSSDNDFRFDNDNGTPQNPYDDRREPRRNAEFAQWQGLIKLRRDWTHQHSTDALLQLFTQQQGLPTWNNAAAPSHLTTEALSAQVRQQQLRLGPIDLAERLYTRIEHEVYNDRTNQIGLGLQHNRYLTWRYGGEVYGEWPIDRHLLTGILQLQRESYHENDLVGPPQDIHRHRSSIVTGLQWAWTVVPEHIRLVPALRWQGYRDGPDDPQAWRGHLDLQLGAKVNLLPSLSLKSNIARYHREPSLYELYGDRGFVLGNPDLTAERGTNWDIGLEWFAAENHSIGLHSVRCIGFQNRITDYIARAYDARGIGRSENIGDARLRGIEFGATAQLPLAIVLRSNVTWLATSDRSDIAAFADKRLPGIFQRSGFLRLQRRFVDLTVFYEYHLEQDLFYDRANLLRADNRTEHNAGIRYLQPRWHAAIEGRNLGNDNYEAFNGFPTPGRAFYGTIGLSF